MDVLENYSLQKHNTFGIDVSAKYFVSLHSEDDILELIKTEKFKKHKKIILGGGSNILFKSDFDGLVINSNIQGINEITRDAETITLEVGSGVIWDDLVNYCVNNGYGGIENLAYIPGKVGAAPIQNIGAYGVEFKDVFIDLDGINLNTGMKENFERSECNFGYRESIFKNDFKDSLLITTIRVKLNLNPVLNTSYRAIKNYLKENNLWPKDIDIVKLKEIVTDIRKSKLPEPSEIGNAGSFFKNPTITKKHLNKLLIKYKDIVSFKIDDNLYKIPAGWLIEKIGYKGKRIGDVGVHKNQALVLVNYGNGSGEEVLKLADEIKSKIFEKFNIILETEVNIV